MPSFMTGILERLRSVVDRDPEARLERELERLEREGEQSQPINQALAYRRAGDLCAGAGEVKRALAYYGRAIDVYLDVEYYDSAAAVCQRLIELNPDVVRARCTRAFLALGKNLPYLPFGGALADARREIGDYVRAAQKAGVEDLAARRLAIMAVATDLTEVREMIGEYLIELGDPGRADHVLGTLYAERNELAEPEADQRTRWAEALRQSVLEVDPPRSAAGAAHEPTPPNPGD